MIRFALAKVQWKLIKDWPLGWAIKEIVTVFYFILPNLPAGKTSDAVETTIHSHVTGTILQNGQVYSHDATVPSNVDKRMFSPFTMNVIVGPLGQATATKNNGSTIVSQPSNGIAVYNGTSSTPYLTLTIKALQKMLK